MKIHLCISYLNSSYIFILHIFFNINVICRDKKYINYNGWTYKISNVLTILIYLNCLLFNTGCIDFGFRHYPMFMVSLFLNWWHKNVTTYISLQNFCLLKSACTLNYLVKTVFSALVLTELEKVRRLTFLCCYFFTLLYSARTKRIPNALN